ncbi:MAG TPA: ferric reductase-like transmembrane domain-containing protein [Acidimicrobiales bacterium]|nr:ferric reductase-like transmembrane domain-containing protein [Acidimicrobiales bacterium]
MGIGFGASVGLAITDEPMRQLTAPGGVLTFLGSLTGLSGTYLALVMVLLVSRLPVVERVLGQDGLLRWHRRLSPWPLSLIAAHAVFLTLADAEVARTGPLAELGSLIAAYPSMLIATVALGIMVAIGTVSIYAVRRRLRRETWWTMHLFMYLALALAFPHEILLGPSFVGHPVTQAVWSAAWTGTAGVVLAYRVGLPVARSLRHRLVVEDIYPETPGVVSVILRGRDLDRLRISGGQFFQWRFLAPGMWWQAHPFSVSARPRPPYLRLTIKAVGDYSAAVAQLRPGTRVAIEGPYGAFTTHARRRQKVALIAGGIGVTAVRSLLEDLRKSSDPVVVLRASRAEDLTLSGEVDKLVQSRKGQLRTIVGTRKEIRVDDLPRLIPDLDDRDIYIAGPGGFVHHIRAALEEIGVPGEAIHYEEYAL